MSDNLYSSVNMQTTSARYYFCHTIAALALLGFRHRTILSDFCSTASLCLIGRLRWGTTPRLHWLLGLKLNSGRHVGRFTEDNAGRWDVHSRHTMRLHTRNEGNVCPDRLSDARYGSRYQCRYHEKKEGTMVVLKVGCRRWWDLHLEFKLSVSLSASDGDPSSGTREEQFPAC
jgi:hypothetical protein